MGYGHVQPGRNSCIHGCEIVAAWFLEGSRWFTLQKYGHGTRTSSLYPRHILLLRPVYFICTVPKRSSQACSPESTSDLLAIKLLQKKSDRDWIFLYLMSFFEVLLAAGLSISLLYLSSFLLYLLVMVCWLSCSRCVNLPVRSSRRSRARASQRPTRTFGIGTVHPAST